MTTRKNQLLRGVIVLSRKMPLKRAYEEGEQKQIRLYGARRYKNFELFFRDNKEYFPEGKEKKPSLMQYLGWGSNGE